MMSLLKLAEKSKLTLPILSLFFGIGLSYYASTQSIFPLTAATVIIWLAVVIFFKRLNISFIAQTAAILVLALTNFLTIQYLPKSFINELNQAKTEEQQQRNYTEDTTPKAAGEIYVEAATGNLVNGGSFSYIKASARGPEAYLGDGKAQAVYQVNAESSGNYQLYIRTDDDALHSDGARSVTVTINQTPLQYKHISENTNGWKWFLVGTAPLKAGVNDVTFTKDADTSAAYVMEAFKFVPVN